MTDIKIGDIYKALIDMEDEDGNLLIKGTLIRVYATSRNTVGIETKLEAWIFKVEDFDPSRVRFEKTSFEKWSSENSGPIADIEEQKISYADRRDSISGVEVELIIIDDPYKENDEDFKKRVTDWHFKFIGDQKAILAKQRGLSSGKYTGTAIPTTPTPPTAKPDWHPEVGKQYVLIKELFGIGPQPKKGQLFEIEKISAAYAFVRSQVDKKIAFSATINAFDPYHQDYYMSFANSLHTIPFDPNHTPIGNTKANGFSVEGPFYINGSVDIGPDEPKNNDGRTVCYWCDPHVVTKKRGGGMYDVCPKCGR